MTGSGHGASDTSELPYARAVGERLRAVRQERRLSLQAVEDASAHEFKASVLGAYERGERVISVARLQRLAVFYDVAVDSLLPVPPPGRPLGARAGDQDGEGGQAAELDARLALVAARDPHIVDRYVRMVRSRRRAPEAAAVTIRAEDVRAMELLLGTPSVPQTPA